MRRAFMKNYRRYFWVLMVAYVALMLLVWPHARSTQSMPWKVALALAPLAPMIAVIWLVGLRVMRSDELEQRVHLLALSVATGVVAALTMAGGFLTAAGVFHLDGDILIWVFPALSLSYGITQLLIGRRYGGLSCK